MVRPTRHETTKPRTIQKFSQGDHFSKYFCLNLHKFFNQRRAYCFKSVFHHSNNVSGAISFEGGKAYFVSQLQRFQAMEELLLVRAEAEHHCGSLCWSEAAHLMAARKQREINRG
jgi:hypothetical protein